MSTGPAPDRPPRPAFLVCVASREGVRITGRYRTEREASDAALLESAPGIDAFYARAGRLR
jgi:hypothetical protein